MATRKSSSVTDDERTPEGLIIQEDKNFAKSYFSRRRILKNLILLGFAFMLDTTPIIGLARLQSSLHRVDGLGVIASSVLYGCLVLSSMFMPKLLISGVGLKWTMVMCYVGYILWIPANGYAMWATMIPASIIVGLCSAPLWASQLSYVTVVAGQYSKLSRESHDVVVTRFMGIFFMFFQFATITGAIVSSSVLKLEASSAGSNGTDELDACGAADCPWYNITSIAQRPSNSTIWTMLVVYIGIAFFAVVIVSFFVDSIPKHLVCDDGGAGGGEVVTSLLATVKQLRHLNQLLLIPLTMYTGFEQAAFTAEWSRSFVTCGFGVWKVGLVTVPFGCANAFASLTFGRLVEFVGRIPVFFTGFIIDLAIQLTLAFWRPASDEEYVLYILSGLWGMADGIWETQINALYGCLFMDETPAAFANFRLWQSLGFVIPFAYSNFLCTHVKLYILTSMLVLGMCGYTAVEFRRRRLPKQQPPETSLPTTQSRVKRSDDFFEL